MTNFYKLFYGKDSSNLTPNDKLKFVEKELDRVAREIDSLLTELRFVLIMLENHE